MSFDPASQAAWLLALADARLHSAAGAAVFKRGQAYAANGSVRNPELTVDAPNGSLVADAVVAGTQNYKVEVWVNKAETMPNGDCNCQHSLDGNFCKHQVALALTLRGLLGGSLGGNAPLADPEAQKKVDAVAKRALTAAKNKDELRVFVEQQSAAALSAWIWQQAQEDRGWMSDLKLWAAQQKAKNDPTALGKAITELLRNSQDFLDYNDCRIYARRAEKALPLLKQALSLDAVQARQLCESALKKLHKVGDHADDSNGEIGWLLEQIQEIHLEAIRAAPPDAAWVETWFALMDADPFGSWDETSVLEVAGEAVVQQYGKKVVRDWDNYLVQSPPKNPASTGNSRVPYRAGSFDPIFYRVRKRYLAYLKQQGDVPAMIEAMLKVAQSSWDYHEVIEVCEAHGKHREALDYALKAQKLYGKDSRIEDDLLRCYVRDGWDAEALVIHRERLENEPSSIHFYAVALDAAVRAGRELEAYQAELFAWLEQYELTKKNGYGYYSTPAGKTRNVTTRVSWLLFDKKPLEALTIVQGTSHYCDASVLHTLATQLPQSHDAVATNLYITIFDSKMLRATSPYADELALVKKVIPRMQPLEASRWVQSLRQTFKAKRNFTQGLPTTFAVPI